MVARYLQKLSLMSLLSGGTIFVNLMQPRNFSFFLIKNELFSSMPMRSGLSLLQHTLRGWNLDIHVLFIKVDSSDYRVRKVKASFLKNVEVETVISFFYLPFCLSGH